MRFFLCSDTSYLGKALSAKLTENGHEIAELAVLPEGVEEPAEPEEGAPPPAEAAVKRIPIFENPELLKSTILGCECILLDLVATPTLSTNVLNILKDAELEEPKTVIGVSSVMSWSRTEAKKGGALKESDYKGRKTSPKFKGLKMMETLVLHAVKENLNAYVVAAGVLYGGGENDFSTLFRDAWMCEKEALPVVGDGNNVVPTLHVADLASFIDRLSASPPPVEEKPYIVVTDKAKNTQKQIVQCIATGLGTGNTASIAADDEKLLLDQSLPVEALSLNLNFETEGSYQAGLEMELSAPGIGAAGVFERCRTDFVEKNKLKPVRVAVLGNPGAGKSYYSAKLANKLYVPHVTLGDIISDAVRAGGEQGESISKILEESAAISADKKKKPKKGKGAAPDTRPRIDLATLTTLIKNKLNSTACRNKGFVLDGYPRTMEEAEALFKAPKAEGEEEEAPQEDEEGNPIPTLVKYNPEFMVQSLVSIDVTEEKANERMMAINDEDVIVGHNDEDGFGRRWERYVANAEDEAINVAPFFSQMETLDIPMEETENDEECVSKMAMYVAKGGAPFNFHPTPSEKATEEANATKAKKAAEEKALADAEKKQKEEVAEREMWMQASEIRKNMVLKEDTELVEQCSLPLRKYLMSNVIPTLVDGLVEVCKVAPEDPVDYLAEYLFKASVGEA